MDAVSAAGRQGAFEGLRPLEPLMNACVHCGFCLPTCPSYVILGKEMDSPRGRIYTMRAGLDHRVPLSPPVVEHFDTCLGCMACETACPSGVRYGPLIEQTRAVVEQQHVRPAGERWFRRLLFSLLPYPFRLRLIAPFAGLAPVLRRSALAMRLLPPRLRALLTLAPPPPPREDAQPVPALTRAAGERRCTAGLVTGCVQRAFFPDVNHATVRLLAARGCEVHAPERQGCCGALSLHAGEEAQARTFARQMIDTFEREPVERIVVNAAGCGSALKSYPHLLRDDPQWAARARAFADKVCDVTEWLAGAEAPPLPPPGRPITVAYHDACHLAHAQGIRREPRQLLAAIPGVTLVPIAESELCCGSAGIFNLVQPEMAATLGGRKADHLAAAAPDVVLTSNPGCILQLRAAAARAGHTYEVRHIVSFLDDMSRH